MTFDPLGPFRAALNAPLPAAVVQAGRDFAATLPTLDPGDRDAGRDPAISRIYGHWSCQPSGTVDGAYNAVVEKVDGSYVIRLSTPPQLNARTYDQHGALLDLAAGYAEHTYHRNTGAIGIALDGMDGTGVGPSNFGADPITTTGLLYLCAGIAGAAKAYAIDISGLSLDADPFYGETSFLTHAEAAHYPGTPGSYQAYWWGDHPDDGDTRGDLSCFTPLPANLPVSFAHATMCGDAIRLVAHRIKVALS